ncbi:ATP phosphoribosyltransferase regulatory subunit [Actinocorallia sp. API 0066]|uniref:ATP phosphoribosyltransferase regulatory subunit n=1 Tax=Actinocorallia sp. API 0066 TaxID=2896846 RepID=UPI001E40D837|nr:ATP phosphoribosyltransferase regulatory subunit [Actinocorallia sp. API 0066]MCD0453244.1 ATP phosphoribosyltransferase regulatory subunit [Actinocorallia sp. API 0066]
MHDVSPDRLVIYDQIRRDWFDVCRLSGFQGVEVPPVGFAETFQAGHNAAGERTYQFPDRAGRDLALISDSLPSVLRLAAGRKLPSQRLTHCTPVFRYERRPRRHFHHLGLMEVHFRTLTPREHLAATARSLTTVADFLADRCAFTVVLTDPGLWRAAISRTATGHVVDQLLNRLRTAPASRRPAILHEACADPDATQLAESIAADPSGAQLLQDGGPEMQRLLTCYTLADRLRAKGVKVAIDLTELHASEFHDGPAFLLRPDGDQRLLGDGGSYGIFAEKFVGAPTSLYSAVLGLERLADLQPPAPGLPPAEIAVLAEPQEEAIKLADNLRVELQSHRIAVWDVLRTRAIRQHLREFADLGLPYSTIIGERELIGAPLVVRSRDGQHHNVPGPDLAAWLVARRNSGA